MRGRLNTAWSVASALLALAFARSAHAGGFELVGQGAQSLARGGAVFARADDPMVLAHNPAGLADLHGTQMLLNLNATLFDACVDPAGVYGWGVYPPSARSRFIDPETGAMEVVPLGQVDRSGSRPRVAARAYYTDPFDTVCLEQNDTPIPQLAWTTRVTDDLGIGFGFIFPAAQPSGRWGGENGVIEGASGHLRPAATRYQLLRSNTLGVFPNVGVGYRLLSWLRIGAAFEWGVIAVNNETMAATLGGTTPANDVVAHVKVQDWFVPALTGSVHLVPIDALDVVLGFRWQDSVRAKGTADLTTGLFDPNLSPTRNVGIDIRSVRQGMPFKLRAGVRYADRLLPRAARPGSELSDPLTDERWDIELDLEYQGNSRVRDQVVDFVDDQEVRLVPAPGLSTGMVGTATVPTEVRIPKRWKDQVSVRLGGTYNVLPGLLGVSAGMHYESQGVTPAYMQVDFWPVQRFGLHTGVLLRVARAVDVVIAYAHVFQDTIIVGVPPHLDRSRAFAEFSRTGTVSTIDKTVGVPIDREGAGLQLVEPAIQGRPDGTAALVQNVSRVAADQPPYIVNAGRYRSGIDQLAIGLNVHF